MQGFFQTPQFVLHTPQPGGNHQKKSKKDGPGDHIGRKETPEIPHSSPTDLVQFPRARQELTL
jgi:hypothetical protein